MIYSNAFNIIAISCLINNVPTALASKLPDYQVLSPRCKSETLRLFNNTAIQAVFPSTFSCGQIIDFTKSSGCSTSYGQNISGEAEAVCLNQGGQFHTENMDWYCHTEINGHKYYSGFYFENFPACFGFSCNKTEIRADFGNVYPQAITTLAERNITCVIKVNGTIDRSAYTSKAVSNTNYYYSMIPLFVSTASITSLLLLWG